MQDPVTEWKQIGPNLFTNNVVTGRPIWFENDTSEGRLSLGQGDCD